MVTATDLPQPMGPVSRSRLGSRRIAFILAPCQHRLRDDSALALASSCADVTGEQRVRDRVSAPAVMPSRFQHVEPPGTGRAKDGEVSSLQEDCRR